MNMPSGQYGEGPRHELNSCCLVYEKWTQPSNANYGAHRSALHPIREHAISIEERWVRCTVSYTGTRVALRTLRRAAGAGRASLYPNYYIQIGNCWGAV